MKLAKPSKVILVGDTEGVEGLFLYFNRNHSDDYPEHPLLDGKLDQVAGFVEDTPILAFTDNKRTFETLNTLLRSAVETDKFSLGFVTSFKDRVRKQLTRYLDWLRTVDPALISRIVFFMDLEEDKKVTFEEFGFDSTFGPEDFMPLDILSIGFERELRKFKEKVMELPKEYRERLITAFDIVFYPISTKHNVGLEPSATVLLMESDS